MKTNASRRPHIFFSTLGLLGSLWSGLLAVGILGLTGCASSQTATAPVASDDVIGDYDNACLPEAVMMAQALRRHGIKARVLIMSGDG